MGRIRLIVSLVAAGALFALLAPGSALAGTYGWNLPGDPGTFAGSNPEHKFGAPSWSYSASSTLTFAGGTWSDGSGESIGASGGNVVMQAGALRSTTITWTNPTSTIATVTVENTISAGLLSCLVGGVTQNIPNGLPTPLTPGATVTVTLNGGLTGCSATGTITIDASIAGPNVALTSPSNGSTITGEPTFSGQASTGFGVSNQITVRVYSGGSVSGAPVQTLTTTASGSSFSVAPSPGLGNGQFTVQAEQDDLAGDRSLSNAVTFTVHNSAPTVTLDSPGHSPLTTSTPTFTGTAGTRSIDADKVALVIYPGTATSASPVRFITGDVGSNGHFSITVTNGLGDAEYTAVAAQSGGSGIGQSSPVTFRIKAHPPALTLTTPAGGASVGRASIEFGGQAGNELGDSSIITVILYHGTRAKGHPIGRHQVQASGPSWVSGWPRGLKLGFYTAVATQSDDAGHTTRTSPHTFLLVPTSKTIGSLLTMTRTGAVSAPVSCLAPSTQTCTGTVLVVTQASFQTTPGGPTGPLEVLFANVQIPGGTTQIIKGTAAGPVASALAHMHNVPVVVTVKLSKSGGGAIDLSGNRTLKIT